MVPEKPTDDEKHLFKASILPPPKEKARRKSPVEQMYGKQAPDGGGDAPKYSALAMLLLAISLAALAVWGASGRRRGRQSSRRQSAGLAQL